MSIPPKRSINLIHKNDIEWIIELWLAIHGGDPAPERIGVATANIIRGLSAHLPEAQQRGVIAALH